MSKDNLPKTTNKDIEEIPVEVAKVIKDLPPQKRNVIIQALAVSKQHSGPLPDADTIRVYNEVIPDGGERLMATVERQLAHRIDIEKTGVTRTFNQSSTGQWMGLAVTILFGVISWDLVKNGHDTAGMIIGGADLVALVTIFVTSRAIGGK